MQDKTKTTIIGCFIIGAILLIAWLLLFLKPTIGDGKQVLLVRFSSVDKISVGTRVTYAGKPVGEVIALYEIHDKRLTPDKRDSSQDKLYIYELKLAIDSSVPVYNTDKFTVHLSGLFGEKSIAIIPTPHKPGKSARIIDGDVVYAESTDPLEGAAQQIYVLSSKMGKALDLIIEMIESNEENINSFSHSIKEVTDRFSLTLNAINDANLVPSLSSATEKIAELSTQLNHLLGDLEKQQFGKHLGEISSHTASILSAVDNPEVLKGIVDNFHKFTEDLQNLHKTLSALSEASGSINKTALLAQNIMENVSEGKGSLGKFVSSDRLYLQTESVINKAQILMNDINHYGLLFHHDKNWQRERAKRINFLLKVDSPKEFQNYFEEEAGTISTSFGRIQHALQRLHGKDKEDLISSKAFLHGFSELLHQVQSLEEQLEALSGKLNEQSEE